MPSAAEGGPLLLELLGSSTEIAVDALSPRGWSALTAAAAWHGVLPLLSRRLRDRGVAAHVPPAQRKTLDDAYTLASVRGAARRSQLREALAAIQARGVRTVVLKGAYVGEHLYGDDALRPMTDLDLLVAPGELEEANAALMNLGYRPTNRGGLDFAVHRHSRPLVRRGRLPIELHRTIEPCAPPFALPLADVWSRVGPVEVADAHTLALAPGDLLIHLAVHLAHSHVLGMRLVSLCDVAAWVQRHGPTTDWDALGNHARRAGAGRFVYAALATTRRALACPVPALALASLGPTPADEAAVRAAVALLAAPRTIPGHKAVVPPPSRGAHGRARRLVHAAFPSPARLREAYGPRGSTLALYAVHVRGGYLRRVASAARLLLSPWAWLAVWRRIAALRVVRAWAADTGQ